MEKIIEEIKRKTSFKEVLLSLTLSDLICLKKAAGCLC